VHRPPSPVDEIRVSRCWSRAGTPLGVHLHQAPKANRQPTVERWPVRTAPDYLTGMVLLATLERLDLKST
jgi:hypothetical protein